MVCIVKRSYVKAFFICCLFIHVNAYAVIATKKITPLFTLTKANSSALSKPSDIAVNDDYIYVVDGDNHRIVVYNKQGKYQKQFGRQGEGRGEFNYPVGIGLDSNGHIYVADTKNHRIQIFSADGDYEKMIKTETDGEPARPVDVTVSDDNKKIYITT